MRFKWTQSVLNRIRERYTPAEQRIWVALVVASLLVVLGLSIWQPLIERRHDASARLVTLERDLAWLERAVRRLPAPTAINSEPVPRREALTRLVTSTAQDLQIPLTRYEQSSDKALRVWLDDLPFQEVLKWLDALAAQGLSTQQAVISRSADPGHVSARFLLINN